MYSWSMACGSHGLDTKTTDCVLMWPCGPIPLSVNASVYICYKSKPGVSMAKNNYSKNSVSFCRQPREVNQYGACSMRSDVGCFGIMMWEIMNSIGRGNCCVCDLVPYANIAVDQV